MRKKHTEKKIGRAEIRMKDSKAIYNGVIIERFKRINGLPPHELDWQSEHFIWRFLGGRKQLSV
jgi:hypothetical protein